MITPVSRPAIAFLVCLVGFAWATRAVEVTGKVVDGLGVPLADVQVDVFAGQQGLEQFEVTARTTLVTAVDGTYAGTIDAPRDHLYRVVSKSGYGRLEQFGDWTNQDDRVVLLRRVELTHPLLEEVFALSGEALSHRLLDLLSCEWHGKEVNLPLEVFLRGDRLRPALLVAAQHQEPRIAQRGKELLAYVGDPRDIDHATAQNARRPSHDIRASDLETAISMASTSLVTETDVPPPFLTNRTVSESGNRALVTWEIHGPEKSGRKCTLVFSREEGSWRFTHYWVVWQS